MDNTLSFLGLAFRAKRLEAGEEPVSAALHTGKAKLCLLASDASDNTKRRTSNWAESAGVEVIELKYTKETLGAALGRMTCAVAVITDKGISDALKKKI